MTADTQIAWNNFVMNSDPSTYPAGDIKRSAAISRQYMSLVNNGGINAFLTASYDLDAADVLESLGSIGAVKAAKQLRQVLNKLGVEIPASSQKTRWEILEQNWTDDLDDLDIISSEADSELLQALEIHVRNDENFYQNLSPDHSAGSIRDAKPIPKKLLWAVLVVGLALSLIFALMINSARLDLRDMHEHDVQESRGQTTDP